MRSVGSPPSVRSVHAQCTGGKLSMEIVKACLDVVALAGLEGHTLEELWLELSIAAPSYLLDSSSKAFIWRQLLHTMEPCPPSPALSLLRLPAPRPIRAPLEDDDMYTHPFPYSAINQDGVRGSCACYHDREDVTSTVLASDMSLSQVEEEFRECLVLVASQELREKALSPSNMEACLSILSDLQYAVLELVGRARRRGVPRPFFGSEYLGIDIRSVFHHVKVLRMSGLVHIQVRHNVQDGHYKTSFTHVVYLRRFPFRSEAAPPIQTLKKRICGLLEKAPFQTLSSLALSQALSKPARETRRARLSLVSGGVVEEVSMSTVSEEYAEMKTKGYRLVKPYQEEEREGEEEEEEEESDNEDDEEDDENDGGELSQREQRPLVFELPLDMQGYRLIESHGPEGMSSTDFFNYNWDLDSQIQKQLVKILLRREKAVSIAYDGKVRMIRLVAPRYRDQNPEYCSILAEQARTDPIPSGEGGATSLVTGSSLHGNQETASEDTAAVSRAPSPSPSRGEAVSVVEVVLGGASKPPTLGQLKRMNMILDFMRELKVIHGHVELMKHIREVELKEGKEHVLDKKTLMRLLQTLIGDGRLSEERVELTIKDEDEAGCVARSVMAEVLYYLPGLEEERVQRAREQAHSVWKGIVYRKKAKGKKGERIKKRTKKAARRKRKFSDDDDSDSASGEGDSGEGSDMSEGRSNPEEEGEELEEEGVSATLPNTGGISKFQRLRHFHYYLWALTRGYGPAHSREKEDAMRGPLSLTHFPWAGVVSQAPPPSSRGEGWVDFSHILSQIPVVLWTILMKIYSGVRQPALPPKYVSYFTDPEKKKLKLYQLPRKVRNCIVHGSRDVQIVQILLRQLKEMGLVEMEGTPTQVFVCSEVSILDTSPTPRRSSFFLNEARSSFKSLSFTLSDLSDLEKYWFELRTICINTEIIIGGRRQVMEGEGREDHSPLPYTVNSRLSRDPAFIESYNQRGFGGGGLPPLAFSHLHRNWATSGGHQVREPVGGVTPPPPCHYGPGVELSGLPSTIEQMEGISEKEEESADEGEGPPKKKRRVVMVPSSVVEQHSGGRGLKRADLSKLKKEVWLKKDPKNAIPSPAVLIIDAEERGVARKKRGAPPKKVESQPERSTWNKKQDTFVLMSYLSCLLLHRLGQPPITFQTITEHFHRDFPSSRTRTPLALKRRMCSRYKKREGVASHLEICVEECLQDISHLGAEAPPHSFRPLLQFVLNKYKSDGIISHGGPFASNLRELHSRYDVVGVQAPPPCVITRTAVMDCPQVGLIADLIISSLSNEQAYDSYKTFKLFETLPEEHLKEAFSYLKDYHFLVKKTSRVRGPIEAMPYDLSTNFHTRLESSLTSKFFHERNEFRNIFESLRATKEVGVFSDPAISLLGDGSVILDGSVCAGGSVAGMVERLVAKSMILGCHTFLPHPLFEQNSDYFPKDGGGKEEGEEEEGKEEVERDNEGEIHSLLDASLQEEEEEEGGGAGVDDLGRDLEEGGGARIDDPEEREGAGIDDLEEGGGAGSSRDKNPLHLLMSNVGGVLRYGPIQLHSSLNIGHLLEPISPCPLVPHPLLEASIAPPSTRCISSYLEMCREHLHFSEEKCEVSREVFHQIQQAGREGVREEEVGGGGGGEGDKRRRSLGEHVKALINFEMVYRVGVVKDLLVSHDHCGAWFVDSSPQNGPTHLIPYAPWMSLESCDPNTDILDKYRHAVLDYIIAHPGVTMDHMVEHFSGTLHYCRLRELLQVLECDDEIKSGMTFSSPTVLFPKRGGASTPTIYYEPVLTAELDVGLIMKGSPD